jgi:hypothetical protein
MNSPFDTGDGGPVDVPGDGAVMTPIGIVSAHIRKITPLTGKK